MSVRSLANLFDGNRDRFERYRDEAQRLWDEANERETAANWRADELLERAAQDVERDIRNGHKIPKSEADRQHWIENRCDQLKAQDREFQNHIGMNQFYHRKGMFAAALAALYQE